jgi:hypothetical protein
VAARRRGARLHRRARPTCDKKITEKTINVGENAFNQNNSKSGRKRRKVFYQHECIANE